MDEILDSFFLMNSLITWASFLVTVVRYELTCSPLLPVPPVGHHRHGPGVEASVTTPGAGAGAETGRRGHDVTCHATSRGSEFLRRV